MADNLPIATVRRFSERDTAIQEQQEIQKEARIEALGEDASLLAFQAGIERENYSANIVKNLMYEQGWSLFGAVNKVAPPKDFTPDPNYYFDDDEANFGYDPNIMIYAQSEQEAFAMRLQVDSENAQMQMINDSAAGTWGVLFGATFQPHVAASIALSPVSLPLAIGTEMALEGASEAVQHTYQLTRTKMESAVAVVFTGTAIAILGGGAKYLSRDIKTPAQNAKLIDDINTGVYDEPLIGTGGDSASAMRTGSVITAEEDKLVGGKLADFFSIGQISNLVNSPSRLARWVGQKLGDNPLFTKAHVAGKTHGVTVESFDKAAMGKTVIAVEKAVPLQKASGLGEQDFLEQVGVAMSNGDRHLNPKVQETAEMYRDEIITPIREAAERVGMLESADDLTAKILEIETEIKAIIKTGEAGPGSKAVREAVEVEKAKIEVAANKTTVKLEKKVKALEVKLANARGVRPDGTKNVAPASMIKQHNDARKLLTAHKKETVAATKAHRERLAAMKKQDEALKAARKAKRDLNKKLATGGTSFAESYFPRIYNQNRILENWDRLASLLEANFKLDKQLSKLSPDKIAELVEDTIQNMMIGRYQNMTVKGEPSPVRARSVSLMDNVLEDFLEKNATEAMLRYTKSMQPQILFKEVFENRTLADLIEEIKGEYRAMSAGEDLTGAERDALGKQQKADIDNLQVMYDRLVHQVQRSIQPRSTIERWLQGSKVLTTAAYLGEIVITSLPDLARPITHYGLRSFAAGFAAMNKQFFAGIGTQHSVQVKRLGAALQRTLNDRAAQFADSLEPQGKYTQKLQKTWSKWSGFDMYTDIVESISAHAAMDYVLRAAKKVSSKTPLSKGERMQISRMGLDEEDLLGIYKESLGTLGAEESTLKYMNTMAWQDVGLAKRVEAGIGSDIKRTILNAGIGDKPAFMDQTWLSWLFQFQTFAMQAQNKMLVAGLQNMNLQTAEGLVVMGGLASSVAAFKAWSRGDDITEWTADKWVAEAVDRSGIAGAMRYPMNMLRWTLATHGILDSAPSRFIDREGASLVIAPGVGLVDSVMKGTTAAIGGDFETAAKKITKALPLNNVWGVRNTLMTLGEK